MESSFNAALQNRIKQTQYDTAVSSSIRDWMIQVFEKDSDSRKILDSETSLPHALRDGILLCRLVNCLDSKVHLDPAVKLVFMKTKKLDNIKMFLNYARNLLNAKNINDLFKPEDLVACINFDRVLKTLQEFKSKMAERQQVTPDPGAQPSRTSALQTLRDKKKRNKEPTKVTTPRGKGCDNFVPSNTCANCGGTQRDHKKVRVPNNWQNWIMNSSDFEYDADDDLLGQGTFGVVYQAKLKNTDTYSFAIKIFKDNSNVARPDFENEVAMLARLRHPNIVLFIGAIIDTKFSIVTEILELGCLDDVRYDLASTYRPNKFVPLLFDMMINICDGMSYIHKFEYIHRDLKSGNVLIDRNYVAKIADFGFARNYSFQEMSTNLGGIFARGTPGYIAPEALKMGGKFSDKSDVFAMAMIMWEMISGEYPYVKECGLNQVEKITSAVLAGRRPLFDGSAKSAPQEYKSLIEDCWDTDPDKRPSFDEIGVRLRKIRITYYGKEKVVL